MSSKRTRERKKLSLPAVEVSIDTTRPSQVSFMVVDDPLNRPTYTSPTGAEISKGKFWFLTRWFRRGIVLPVKAHKTAVSMQLFHQKRRRLSFYRNNG